MYVVIRVAVMSAIAIAYHLTRGFNSPFVDTCAMSLLAVFTGHAVVLALRALREDSNRQLLAALGITVIIAGGALTFLLVHAPHRAAGPLAYRTVDELAIDPASSLGDELKLHGYVELGSMTQRIDHAIDHATVVRRFTLAQNKQRITVEYAGPIPDTLQERAEVIATGRLSRAADGTYVFAATDLIAKCPSTYQTATGPVPASKYR